ncbi:MFS transporter [Lachnotalea sp. AF33-28]|uniref:MFS transporter n=1 Tax=Lachnotalea sp. AF33-28 TaxID=2292046 RepID=UPI000E4D6A8E|nr:MFS transporter [Lachnotalea sp. AF33-28]RHP31507.1 MFS transporter [Lachnotalea sp. AF33-28]
MSDRKTSSLRYAVGMFGTSIPINMFKTYAAAFYVMGRGVTTSQLALVLFIYTFVDAIDNPVYGFLSDRTRTRWGRRRLWLVIGTPLLVLSFIGFFNVPSFIGPGSVFAYMLLMYILTGTLDSLINANYAALFPEMFKTDTERAKTNALRQAFQLVAMVISIALTPVVTDKLGYGTTALIYGLLAGAVILFMALGCHEPAADASVEKPRLLNTLKDMLTNPKFWIYGLTNAFYSAAMALVMAAVPFYVQYTLGLSGIANTVLLGVVLLLAMGCVAIWAHLVKKFTLMPVWRTALIFMGLSFIPLYFASGLVSAICGCVAVGIGFAGVITTMDLVGARIMDEDCRIHGLKREGTYASAMGFMNRLSGLFTSLAFLLVGSLYGFESGDVPGPHPAQAARFLLVIFPFCAMILSVLCSRFLKFPELDGDGTKPGRADGAL